MHLIKVSATESTNSFARELFREKQNISLTCIWTDQQLKGRGQRGTSWHSEPGKNLTFSIVFPRPAVRPPEQFLLSATVALGLVEALQKWGLPSLQIKWPNDILSAEKKIAGILIENIIVESKIAASIIGVGLNVNQDHFSGLPSAGSMKEMIGSDLDRQEVLDHLLQVLEVSLDRLPEQTPQELLGSYKKYLFKYGIPTTFELPSGDQFTGIIADVNIQGKLLIRTSQDLLQEFDLKEIKFCYGTRVD